MSGVAEFRLRAPVALAFPFERSNFTAGHSMEQLNIAGLAPVDILLEAYRATENVRYLRGAADEIVAFEWVDRFSVIPTGFQWNDHALANSISILTDLWSYVRVRDDLDPKIAGALLRLVARTADRLSKPTLFTYRTNHGVMESIALLQVAAAFPALKSAHSYGELGCSRLKEQIPYYISPEGVVLEHSAGYHELGRELLDIVLQLSYLGDCKAPAEWHQKLEASRAFSALLWRPDGSTPVFGNTDGANRRPDGEPAANQVPSREFSLFPVSGYSIWWDGLESWPKVDRASQTIVSWSNFPSKAHRHADDLSVLIWSRGISWITSVGYWPYEDYRYAAAQSWNGANAPHFENEPDRDVPPARVVGFADSQRLRAIALERHAAGGRALLRRQVVEIDGSIWLIADSVSGTQKGKVKRLWTASARTEWGDSTRSGRLLQAKDTLLTARISNLGDLSIPPSYHSGENNPLAGWNILDGNPTAAPALSVVQDGPVSLVVTVIEVDEEQRLHQLEAPTLLAKSDGGDWSVVLATRDGLAKIGWASDQITVDSPRGSRRVLLNAVDTDWAKSRSEILSAYQAMTSRYSRFREVIPYRFRWTGFFCALLVIQELIFLALRRYVPKATTQLRLCASGLWLLFGSYCAYVLLR